MSFRPSKDRTRAPHLVAPQRDECGAEAIEVVFVLPLLVLFVVAILHFGLQMVSAEAFVSKADAAVMALTIDEESVRQADEEALKASANSDAAFSSDDAMRVVSVNVGAEKQLTANGTSGNAYIPLTYTVSCRLPKLLGTGDAKPIEKTVVRRIPVKDAAMDEDDKAPNASDGGDKPDEAGDSTGKQG